LEAFPRREALPSLPAQIKVATSTRLDLANVEPGTGDTRIRLWQPALGDAAGSGRKDAFSRSAEPFCQDVSDFQLSDRSQRVRAAETHGFSAAG
jgi:hypothetical protein